MDRLPTYWGQHDKAEIEATLVNGRFITSIMEAPADWGERLRALGFKKTSNGWLRFGHVSHAEFATLSPEIRLVGFDEDFLFEVESVDMRQFIVPVTVRDAILALWRDKPASLIVGLSMEHAQSFDRGRAWSVVEAALAGEMTDETDTVFGLALTKMNTTNTLDSDAEVFADKLGWQRPAPSARFVESKAPILLARGESISWMEDGVLTSGRLARNLTVDDGVAYAYRQHTAFVGGYAVVAPVPVQRTQLYFNEPTYDWLDSDLVSSTAFVTDTAGAAEVALDEALTKPITITSQQLDFAYYVIERGSGWPVGQSMQDLIDGVKGFDQARDVSTARFTEDNEAWLLALHERTEKLARAHYGALPVSISIDIGYDIDAELNRIKQLELRLVPSGARGRAQPGNTISRPIVEGSLIDLHKALESADVERRGREKLLRASARKLASDVGIDGLALPEGAFFARGEPLYWPARAKAAEGQLSEDQVIADLSVSLTGKNFDLVGRVSKRNLANDLVLDTYLENKTVPHGAERVVVSPRHLDAELVPLDSVLEVLNGLSMAEGDPSAWLSNIQTEAWIKYTVSVRLDAQTLRDKELGSIAGVSLAFSVDDEKHTDTLNLVDTADEVLEACAAVVASIKPRTLKTHQAELETFSAYLSNFGLIKRLHQVPITLRAMSTSALTDQVRAQVMRQDAKRFSVYQAETQEKMLGQLVECLRKDKSHGAVLYLAKTARYLKYWYAPAEMSSTTVASTRKVALDAALFDFKNRLRARGVGLVVDGLSIADPELAAILNDEQLTSLDKPAADQAEGAYTDVGVVSGLALKDIRAMSGGSILELIDNMSDAQKGKYITRESIWPRKSFLEMKEAGADIRNAYVYDLVWKAMPKQPETMGREHVRAFVQLVSSYKALLDKVVSLPFGSNVEEASFSHQIKAGSLDAWCELDGSVQRLYFRKTKLRGFALHYSDLNLDRSNKFKKALEELSWDTLIKAPKKTATSSTGSRVMRGQVVRIGDDHRQGKSVVGEDFIRTFGFSGVEYGNWTSLKEREKHLNLAFDSMMDFAKELGVEPMALSLGGKLGLCIGSRGKGGKRAAAAHFEPVNMAINLTRMSGDGSLAHEYFHAVARHYGQLATGVGQDWADAYFYPMTVIANKEVPACPESGLRAPMQQAFFNLMVAITRSPSEGDKPQAQPSDHTDLAAYRYPSDMLKEANKLDNGGKTYWAEPCELFARAMECWFKQKLHEKGQRNDYLVSAAKGIGQSEAYPGHEQAARIKQFADQWVNSLETEIKSVAHPFLGNIELPVLNSELKSVAPFSLNDLAELAKEEMGRLFAECSPSLMLVSDKDWNPGLYDVARNLIVLNDLYADRGTFYHEAWHACHHTLLNHQEREGMASLFAPEGAMAARLAEVMRADGVDEQVIDHMLTDTQEVQAYAFQYWEADKFSFDEEAQDQERAFYRVDAFVDGVTGVTAMFGAQDAQRLFEQFKSGQLASRQAEHSAQVDWDEDNTFFWEPPAEEPAVAKRGMRLG